MLYFNAFVLIFVLLVCIYLVINLKILSPYDITFLSISIIILLITTIDILIPQKKYNIEKFSTTTDISTIDVSNILSKYTKIDSEEDISDIQTRLCIYLTVFNKKSFNNMGKVWYNIANIKQDGTCPDTDNSKFNFDLNPAFNRASGIYLGNNRIIGPLSNALDIQFHNTYTIVLTCKHGNLLVDNKNQEIELLKLYANSPNNNGLSLFIEKGSIHNDNNTQVGSLILQYADHNQYECLVDKQHNYINLDKDVLTFYFIIKDTDNVRVLMMTEGSTNIHLILKFNITNTDVTFSNKELLINRLLNWNSTLYNFAIYDKALSDENVSNFYTHIMNEYLKNLDPNFNTMLSQYNDSINLIQALLKCPYDKTVATKCSSIKSWCDVNQLMNAPLQCRKSINDYCANNTANPLCKCWDTSSTMFNSDNCKLYRSIFSGERTSSFEGLTAEDLEYIKNKYGLIWPHECPTTISKPKFIENSYNKYDWNKLKVYLDPEDRTTGPDGKVLPMYYPDEEESLAKARQSQLTKDEQSYDSALDWDNRRIKGFETSDDNNDYESSNKAFGVTNYYKAEEDSNITSNKNKELSVPNVYKYDKNNINKNINETQAIKTTNNILSSAKKEQADLLDPKKEMQINNLYKNDKSLNPQNNNTNPKTSSDGVTNVFTKLANKPTQPTSQVSDKIGSTLPPSDTFFNKFMKVMLPTSQ